MMQRVFWLGDAARQRWPARRCRSAAGSQTQNLPPEFFRDFPGFLNFAFDSRDLISAWLVGHPVLAHTLDRAPYAALASRIQIDDFIHQILDLFEARYGDQIRRYYEGLGGEDHAARHGERGRAAVLKRRHHQQSTPPASPLATLLFAGPTDRRSLLAVPRCIGFEYLLAEPVRLANEGLRTALFYNRAYARILHPGMAPVVPAPPASSPQARRQFHVAEDAAISRRDQAPIAP